MKLIKEEIITYRTDEKQIQNEHLLKDAQSRTLVGV